MQYTETIHKRGQGLCPRVVAFCPPNCSHSCIDPTNLQRTFISPYDQFCIVCTAIMVIYSLASLLRVLARRNRQKSLPESFGRAGDLKGINSLESQEADNIQEIWESYSRDYSNFRVREFIIILELILLVTTWARWKIYRNNALTVTHFGCFPLPPCPVF